MVASPRPADPRLGAAALAWWVFVVGMTLDGYPGLERFFLPAAGVTCVLAGVGLVRVAELGGARVPAAACATAGDGHRGAVLVACRFRSRQPDQRGARGRSRPPPQAVTRLDQLTAAVAAVGGHDGVFPCKSSFAAVNHGVQTALAFKLHVTLERVGTSMRHQGVMFVGPHDSIDGGRAGDRSPADPAGS